MSIEALNWAFNMELPNSGMKCVLLTLANYCNEYGEAYPSQKEIAKKSCLSERGVRDNLARLEELEVITRIPRTRSNGSYTTDLFRINVGMKLPAAESADGKNFQTQRQILPNPAADSAAPEPSLTTTITKSNLPAHAQAREALVAEGIPVEHADKWIRIRELKQQPWESGVIELMRMQADQAGITLRQAVACCVAEGWSWFKSSWYAKLNVGSGSGGAHGPPKASAEKGWRDSPDGVNRRGKELCVLPMPGESSAEYLKRVEAEDWERQKKNAASVIARHKARTAEPTAA